MCPGPTPLPSAGPGTSFLSSGGPAPSSRSRTTPSPCPSERPTPIHGGSHVPTRVDSRLLFALVCFADWLIVVFYLDLLREQSLLAHLQSMMRDRLVLDDVLSNNGPSQFDSAGYAACHTAEKLVMWAMAGADSIRHNVAACGDHRGASSGIIQWIQSPGHSTLDHERKFRQHAGRDSRCSSVVSRRPLEGFRVTAKLSSFDMTATAAALERSCLAVHGVDATYWMGRALTAQGVSTLLTVQSINTRVEARQFLEAWSLEARL